MTPLLYREAGVIHVNFILLCRRVKVVGLTLGAMALGSWVTSIRVGEADLAYKTSATAKLETLQRVAGPNPAKTIDCLKKKVETTEKAAESEFMVDVSKIPDCPTPAKKK